MPANPDAAIVLDKPWQIHLFRLAAFKHGLALQIRGIKVAPGVSVLAKLRAEGIVSARTAKAAMPQLLAHIADVKTEYGLLCTVCRENETTHAITGPSGNRTVNVCDTPQCTEFAARDADVWDVPA